MCGAQELSGGYSLPAGTGANEDFGSSHKAFRWPSEGEGACRKGKGEKQEKIFLPHFLVKWGEASLSTFLFPCPELSHVTTPTSQGAGREFLAMFPERRGHLCHR